MKLAEHVSIKLISLPGHREIEGNEIVSHLARASSGCPLIGPEPSYGISENFQVGHQEPDEQRPPRILAVCSWT